MIHTAGALPLSERIPQVLGLQCVLCGRRYRLEEAQYVCEDCGQVGTLDVLMNPAAVWPGRHDPHSPKANYWEEERFLPLAHDLPGPEMTVPLKVGNTPYYHWTEGGSPFGKGRSFAVKDDGRNPTASFKDRASRMVVHHAITIGAKVVATASTGNAAAALAGMCAVTQNVQAVIFVPATAPPAKIAQLLVYGAKVILVDGPYDTAFDLCWEACQEFGWYNRSTGINPFTSEGKKTVAWEIAFSGYELPEAVVVSVGDGSIISGLYKGFSDLLALGWVGRIPRLIGVQSTGSQALVQAWEQGLDAREMIPQPAQTLADSISASLPRDRAKALRAVRKSGGAMVAVPDEDILAAIPALAQTSGVFAEPAGAAAYAGWCEAVKQGYLDSDSRVLILNTGSGLKDIRAAMQASHAEALKPLPPTVAAVRQAIKDWNLG
jgi:threonine synthase